MNQRRRKILLIKKLGDKESYRFKGSGEVLTGCVFSNNAIVDSMKTFYGIDESFPFSGHLVARNSDTDHVKRIYYVSKSVNKDVLDLNFKRGQQLKMTSIGLKMLVSWILPLMC